MTSTGRHYATIWEGIADRLPEAPALQHGERRTAWREFEDRSARVAGMLAAHGIGAGDGVAAYLYNCPEYFEVFFGALKHRAVPSNVNYRYGRDELSALLENSDAKALFFDAALRDKVVSVAERAGGPPLLVEIGGDGSTPIPGAHTYDDLLSEVAPAPRIRRNDDDTFLSYTGGTTGLPKGVLFDIGQSLGNTFWFRDLFVGGEPTTLEPVEYAVELAERGESLRAIPASPLMHSTGFIFASLPTLTAGGLVTTLVHRSFDAHELLSTVETTGTNVIGIVGDAFALPTARALDEGKPGGGRYDVSSVRVMCSAGVAWSAHVKERLFDHMPQLTLLDSCGSTEGVAFGIGQVRRGDPVATANFQAAPGLIVLSPDGKELPPGEVGMLAGPTTASGYHRDPDKTAATFFDIGGQRYAMPGDFGRIEPDGTVTLLGRGVTTINTGGEKVYPGEVEEAIRALADVDDCLVVGVPDERFGHAVAALVVRVPDRALASDDVVAAVRASLAGYKVPRRIVFVEQVPRLPNGKVDYDASRKIAEEA
jgi:fatty-acyl-CoA synthase